MIKLENIFECKPNEQVYQVVRRHSAVLIAKLICAGVLLVIPFFFLFFLTQWKTAGLIIFAVIEAIGLVLAIRAFIAWDGTVLILTTHRVCQVHQQGLWKRRVVDTPFVFIDGVRSERAGLGDALFGTGTLHIQTTGSGVPVIANWMATPEKLQSTIHDLREKRAWQVDMNTSDEAGPGSAGQEHDVELEVTRERVARMLVDMDKETLKTVEQLLHNTKKGEYAP
ncbi:PH domain-containing protein [Candidatus Uhrbacteria bacterium]|nr:PH domain-containing protein [Candidatus Uhrbacteria bacterium]